MKTKNRHDTTRDDENDDDLSDHGEDLDWSELGGLYMRMYEDDVEEPDFSLLAYYARDARCERHETRHRRY